MPRSIFSGSVRPCSIWWAASARANRRIHSACAASRRSSRPRTRRSRRSSRRGSASPTAGWRGARPRSAPGGDHTAAHRPRRDPNRCRGRRRLRSCLHHTRTLVRRTVPSDENALSQSANQCGNRSAFAYRLAYGRDHEQRAADQAGRDLSAENGSADSAAIGRRGLAPRRGRAAARSSPTAGTATPGAGSQPGDARTATALGLQRRRTSHGGSRSSSGAGTGSGLRADIGQATPASAEAVPLRVPTWRCLDVGGNPAGRRALRSAGRPCGDAVCAPRPPATTTSGGPTSTSSRPGQGSGGSARPVRSCTSCSAAGRPRCARWRGGLADRRPRRRSAPEQLIRGDPVPGPALGGDPRSRPVGHRRPGGRAARRHDTARPSGDGPDVSACAGPPERGGDRATVPKHSGGTDSGDPSAPSPSRLPRTRPRRRPTSAR